MDQGGFDIEALLRMIKEKKDANSPFAASDMIATIGDDSYDYARGGYADGGMSLQDSILNNPQPFFSENNAEGMENLNNYNGPLDMVQQNYENMIKNPDTANQIENSGGILNFVQNQYQCISSLCKHQTTI